MPIQRSCDCDGPRKPLDDEAKLFVSNNQPATGSTSQTFTKILDYLTWILPVIMLIATVVMFFVRYRQYERQKTIDAQRITRQL
jgi:hypothetical protein